MEEIDIHAKLAQIETAPHFSMIFDGDTEKAEMIAEHLMWLHSIRRERPLVSRPYKVGIFTLSNEPAAGMWHLGNGIYCVKLK